MDAVEINTSEPPQNDESIVSTVEICRVCLLGNLVMRDLFPENEVASLSAKAMSFANVKMLPGDGLPTRVCCICADKLESAYEFKLQVEQADTVLRERFVAVNMKEELFFNEVEVHLEAGERNESIDDMHIQSHYSASSEALAQMSQEEKSSLLKDHLALIHVEKLEEHQQLDREQDEGRTMVDDVDETIATGFVQGDPPSHGNKHDIDQTTDNTMNGERRLKRESTEIRATDSIATDEHDYVSQQSLTAPCETRLVLREESFSLEGNTEECMDEVAGGIARSHGEAGEEESVDAKENFSMEEEPRAQNETRRSKRKSARRTFATAKRDSDEENYFENLNLSSRLKKVTQTGDRSEKIYFVCYLCDKQFLSKNVLKEHMHSHDEVRRAFSLKKTPEKLQKSTGSPVKMPPSGKKANKCPYCGKEYLYIISFSKHLKQHEKEKEESMPLEISFHEDEHSLDLEDYEGNRHHTDTDVRKRTRRREDALGRNLSQARMAGEERGGESENEGEGEETAMSVQRRGSKSGRSSGDKESPMKRLYAEAFSCDKCTERFYTRRGLQKHAITHISLKCSVCEEEFDSLEKLRNHRTKHVVEGVLTEQDLQEDTFGTIDRDTSRVFDENAISKREHGVGEEEDVEEDEEEEEDEEQQQQQQQQQQQHLLRHQLIDEEDVDGDKERGEDEGTGRRVEGEDLGISEQDGASEETEFAENTFRRNSRNAETLRARVSYGCKTCNEEFTKKDQLQRHAELQHGRVKSYKCTQCNKIFGNELTLRNHLIATSHKTFVHGQEYDPNKRIKRVAARAAQRIIDKIKTEDGLDDYDEDVDEDVDSASGDRAGYEGGGGNGRGKREAFSQKRCHYRKDLECATCNKRCGSKQSLAKHMEQHVKDEKATERTDKSRRPLERKEQQRSGCGVNDNADHGNKNDEDDDSDFESGLDWPMDNHECATCKKRYSTKKSLLRHQLLHEEPNFECDICNVKFYRKDKLKAHYDKCSEKNPDQVRKCNICGDSFENNEILREHRSKHVTEGILTEEDLREIEPRPEEKKQGEKIGRKRRTDIVGLECTECNKQYTSRKGLLRHIQVHEGKKYLCDICPKKFYRREHLKIHVAKHNMIKPYKCTRCTKRFIKEEQLTNHLSKHDRTFKKNKETDSSKRFLCEICSKSFTQSTTLIAHLRAHNGIKPYVCEVCSRPFTTNAYLKMHMRTHTQERPYICQYCSRAFARADTLANHLTSHTGEAKYHCKYCPKNFRRLKSLKEHVFIHTGQRPYACPTCDRRFNNNGSRYAHSKRCKQNFVQNQNRAQTLTQVQPTQNQHRVLHQTALGQGQLVKAQNIKTITIARQPEPVTAQQVMQHQEILMPLILPLTVTLTDVGEEVILPEGTKIFTTS